MAAPAAGSSCVIYTLFQTLRLSEAFLPCCGAPHAAANLTYLNCCRQFKRRHSQAGRGTMACASSTPGPAALLQPACWLPRCRPGRHISTCALVAPELSFVTAVCVC
jgi:hypothetical protein